MDTLGLFIQTVLFRPYVFIFLTAFLASSVFLIGWPRTWRFWLTSWATAFLCELTSTRTGIPFGWYHYNGSTVGQELYLSNIPFMASLSFSFILFAAYSVALCLLLPEERCSTLRRPPLVQIHFGPVSRSSRNILILTSLLFALIDMVIDPVALRGDRWFLGSIYHYDSPGIHFGVPLTNYLGWMVVGVISLLLYFVFDRRLDPLPAHTGLSTTHRLLMGVGLYYLVLAFNLGVTFWIGEWHMGISGAVMYLPITAWLVLRLTGYLHPFTSLVIDSSTNTSGNQTRDFV